MTIHNALGFIPRMVYLFTFLQTATQRWAWSIFVLLPQGRQLRRTGHKKTPAHLLDQFSVTACQWRALSLALTGKEQCSLTASSKSSNTCYLSAEDSRYSGIILRNWKDCHLPESLPWRNMLQSWRKSHSVMSYNNSCNTMQAGLLWPAYFHDRGRREDVA